MTSQATEGHSNGRPQDAAPARNGDGKAVGSTVDPWRLSLTVEGCIRHVLTYCPSALQTYLAVLLHAHWKTGIAFPSTATIVKMAKRSKRNVLRDLDALKTVGVVEIDGKHKSATGRPGNSYRLTPVPIGDTTEPNHPLNGDTTEPNHPLNGDTTEPKNGSLVPSVSEFGSLAAEFGSLAAEFGSLVVEFGSAAEPEPFLKNPSSKNPSQGNKNKNKRARATDQDQAFQEWWEVYPRKVAKLKAEEAWRKAVARIAARNGRDIGAAQAKLLETTKLFATSPKGQAERFCPYPTTWLNGGRYDDDPGTWELDSQADHGRNVNDPRGTFAAAQLFLGRRNGRDPSDPRGNFAAGQLFLEQRIGRDNGHDQADETVLDVTPARKEDA